MQLLLLLGTLGAVVEGGVGRKKALFTAAAIQALAVEGEAHAVTLGGHSTAANHVAAADPKALLALCGPGFRTATGAPNTLQDTDVLLLATANDGTSNSLGFFRGVGLAGKRFTDLRQPHKDVLQRVWRLLPPASFYGLVSGQSCHWVPELAMRLGKFWLPNSVSSYENSALSVSANFHYVFKKEAVLVMLYLKAWAGTDLLSLKVTEGPGLVLPTKASWQALVVAIRATWPVESAAQEIDRVRRLLSTSPAQLDDVAVSSSTCSSSSSGATASTPATPLPLLPKGRGGAPQTLASALSQTGAPPHVTSSRSKECRRNCWAAEPETAAAAEVDMDAPPARQPTPTTTPPRRYARIPAPHDLPGRSSTVQTRRARARRATSSGRSETLSSRVVNLSRGEKGARSLSLPPSRGHNLAALSAYKFRKRYARTCRKKCLVSIISTCMYTLYII